MKPNFNRIIKATDVTTCHGIYHEVNSVSYIILISKLGRLGIKLLSRNFVVYFILALLEDGDY